jgi:hypothetical protein
MNVKDFMITHPISGFEIIDNIILSVVSDEVAYAVEADTSSIECGRLVEVVTDFTIEDDILSIGEIHININYINLVDEIN